MKFGFQQLATSVMLFWGFRPVMANNEGSSAANEHSDASTMFGVRDFDSYSHFANSDDLSDQIKPFGRENQDEHDLSTVLERDEYFTESGEDTD